jgi:hypothetical protein
MGSKPRRGSMTPKENHPSSQENQGTGENRRVATPSQMGGWAVAVGA